MRSNIFSALRYYLPVRPWTFAPRVKSKGTSPEPWQVYVQHFSFIPKYEDCLEGKHLCVKLQPKLAAFFNGILFLHQRIPTHCNYSDLDNFPKVNKVNLPLLGNN